MDKAVFIFRIAVRVIAIIALGAFFYDAATWYSEYRTAVESAEALGVMTLQLDRLIFFAAECTKIIIIGIAWIALEIALKGAKDDEAVDIDASGTVVTTADVKV